MQASEFLRFDWTLFVECFVVFMSDADRQLLWWHVPLYLLHSVLDFLRGRVLLLWGVISAVVHSVVEFLGGGPPRWTHHVDLHTGAWCVLNWASQVYLQAAVDWGKFGHWQASRHGIGGWVDVVFLVDFVHVGGGHCGRREVFSLVWLFVFEVVDGGD
jgi:hypothetical protein